jgi:hypothetical protein
MTTVGYGDKAPLSCCGSFRSGCRFVAPADIKTVHQRVGGSDHIVSGIECLTQFGQQTFNTTFLRQYLIDGSPSFI